MYVNVTLILGALEDLNVAVAGYSHLDSSVISRLLRCYL